MSGSYIGPDSTFNQEVWRPGLTHEAERQTMAMGFVGPDEDMPGVLLEDLTRKRGDTINRNFSPTYDPSIDDGASSVTHLFGDTDETLGDEDEIDTYKDSIVIDHLKTAWRVRGVMSQQRVGWDQKQQIFTKAGKIWSRVWDTSWLNQLCGYTPAMGAGGDDYRLTGQNAVVAPDSAHHFFCSADHTADESFDATTYSLWPTSTSSSPRRPRRTTSTTRSLRTPRGSTTSSSTAGSPTP